jgi:hypothetical protein
MRKSPTSGCYADKARTGSSEDFGQEVLLGEVFQTALVVRDQLPWPDVQAKSVPPLCPAATIRRSALPESSRESPAA